MIYKLSFDFSNYTPDGWLYITNEYKSSSIENKCDMIKIIAMTEDKYVKTKAEESSVKTKIIIYNDKIIFFRKTSFCS